MGVNYTEAISKDQFLSTIFTVGDLTVTDSGLYNMPTRGYIPNLEKLASTLELLWNKIGPFDIISGFRTSSLQNYLRGVTAQAASSKSLHELGQAADIQPTSMPADEYFSKIVTDPDLRYALGEIALKTKYNRTLHLSLPTFKATGKVMVVDTAGKYISLTPQEILAYVRHPISIVAIATVFLGAAGFLWYKTTGKAPWKSIKDKFS